MWRAAASSSKRTRWTSGTWTCRRRRADRGHVPICCGSSTLTPGEHDSRDRDRSKSTLALRSGPEARVHEHLGRMTIDKQLPRRPRSDDAHGRIDVLRSLTERQGIGRLCAHWMTFDDRDHAESGTRGRSCCNTGESLSRKRGCMRLPVCARIGDVHETSAAYRVGFAHILSTNASRRTHNRRMVRRCTRYSAMRCA